MSSKNFNEKHGYNPWMHCPSFPNNLETFKMYIDRCDDNLKVNYLEDLVKRATKELRADDVKELIKYMTLELSILANPEIKAYLRKLKNIQSERIIAYLILEQHNIKTIREVDQIYFYEKGVYLKDKNDTFTREWIDNVAEDYEEVNVEKKDKICIYTLRPYKLTSAKRNNIIEFIKAETFCSIDEFESDQNIINLKNGLYKIEGFNGSNEEYFITHEEYKERYGDYYFSLIQFPIIYMKDAENLEIDQILTDIFGFDLVPLIYQMMAYIFMPNVKYGKAFMLYGETHTGKTTFLNILYQLIRIDYIANLELQDLGKRFQLFELMNKIVNIFDDLGNKPLYDNKWFRKIVTNSRLIAEKKNVQDHISWNNRTKLIYACNELPEVKNECNEAFFTRWVLISTNNDMRDLDGFDHSIRDKKYSEEEIAGTFNKIIEAWKTLEDNKGFPKEWNDIEYVKDVWLLDSNPLGLFIKEKCELDPSYQFERKLFLQEVNKFREEKHAYPISLNKCTRALVKCLGANNSDEITVQMKEDSLGWYPSRLSDRDYRGIRIKDYVIDDRPKQIDEF